MLLGIILIFAIVLISPVLYFFGGWITGWIIKITIGNAITSGLALIGLNIPIDKLPLFFATIAIIASFFHSSSQITTLKEKKI